MRRNWQDLHFGGARQSLLLDIMLWSHMGRFAESCGVRFVEDSTWNMSGPFSRWSLGSSYTCPVFPPFLLYEFHS